MNEVSNEIIEKKPYEYLKEYMEKEKLTQGAVGELLGTNQGSISLILKDKKQIKEEWAVKLAERFGCEKELFFKPKLETKNGEVVTSVSVGTDSVGDGSQEKPVIVKEKLKAKEVPANASEVSISFGLTKSLGNFEFFRCDVFAKDFCAVDAKQKTWDLLEKEVSERLEKVLQNMDKYRSAPAGLVTSMPELPPLEVEEVKPKETQQDETTNKNTPFYEFKKLIHIEMVRLAKLGKLKFHYAVTKLTGITWSEQFAEDLLSQLKVDDVSFFVGETNGNTSESESSGSEDSSQGNGEG